MTIYPPSTFDFSNNDEAAYLLYRHAYGPTARFIMSPSNLVKDGTGDYELLPFFGANITYGKYTILAQFSRSC